LARRLGGWRLRGVHGPWTAVTTHQWLQHALPSQSTTSYMPDFKGLSTVRHSLRRPKHRIQMMSMFDSSTRPENWSSLGLVNAMHHLKIVLCLLPPAPICHGEPTSLGHALAMQNSINNCSSTTREAAVVLELEHSNVRLIGYRPIS